MGVPEKADGGVLVGETGRGGQFVEHIPPALGAVEGRVDNRKARDHPDILQFAQPLAVFLGQLFPGPVDRLGRGRVESVKWSGARAVFVMVAFDTGDSEVPDDLQAFLGVCVVSDDIAQAGGVGALLEFDVFQNDG